MLSVPACQADVARLGFDTSIDWRHVATVIGTRNLPNT